VHSAIKKDKAPHVNPVAVLTTNAAAQLFASSLLGFYMLLPRQPWLKGVVKKPRDPKSLLSVHLDLIMLAFMQFGAAFIMAKFVPPSATVAVLLAFGGWMNPLPYLFRGFGIDAFALGGPPRQIAAAALAGVSSTGITVAWGILLFRLVT
jgi:hypothetical protein